MPALDSDLRRQLESVIVNAREVAEAAARSALQKRAVDAAEPFPHFTSADKEQRNRLRARGRQAGDVRQPKGTQGIDQLAQELAYEYWHRMLFARFLAENHLLMHPDGVAVSLEECEELAPTADPPAANGFALAARFASGMLPQIFRTDDVLLDIEFAPEQRLALEKLLNSLPKLTFEADDSLGWVYQFWQTKKKDEVNASGEKIDGRTLPAVTQLFTEPYMVQFLLHNTIGAWWTARNPERTPPVPMEYLRWRDDGTPTAGTFPGWPKTLQEFTLLDPCCGSGHFLVAAFQLLVPLRMHDEKLSARDACNAVLRENLHGLELDPRCTQIAAFALALAAWKYPDAGGYRELPTLNIACSGQGVAGKKDDWLKLANGDPTLRNGMERLYELFERAPHLGSLIDPRRQDGDLFTARHAELDTLLKKALAKHAQDADLSSVGVAARGITAAADLLARQYTFVVTNVPYLGRGKQGKVLKEYIETHYPLGKADLATAFVIRCLQLCSDVDAASRRVSDGAVKTRRDAASTGTVALVTPQNWLFLTSYKKLREELLKRRQWNLVARLGPKGFQTPMWDFNIQLGIISAVKPGDDHRMAGLDVAEAKTPADKAERLADRVPTPLQVVEQAGQLRNPDASIVFSSSAGLTRLKQYANATQGLISGDNSRHFFQFWELPSIDSRVWARLQKAPESSAALSGCHSIVRWEDGKGVIASSDGARVCGVGAWGKRGVAIGVTAALPTCQYTGQIFDCTVAPITAIDPGNLLAIAAFVTSESFPTIVREQDQALSVTEASFLKVPFDLAHWQAVAAEKYPNGLPEPHSDDPTQWLFKGDIATSTDPLQVAVARLLGYRWPDQVDAASRRVSASSSFMRQDATQEATRQDAASTLIEYFDSRQPVENVSGNLPHWRQEGVTYFVTFRTADSMPQEKLHQWSQERDTWLLRNPLPHTKEQLREYDKRFTQRFEHWLDAGYGSCLLGRDNYKSIVEAALRHFNGLRYHLDEFIVMPNHVHVLVTPIGDNTLSEILHSWKSFTAKEINRLRGVTGEFWQKESFDHIVRSAEYLDKYRKYIRENPNGVVAAGRGVAESFGDTRQDAASTIEHLVDDDGIVCLPGVRHEAPAAERLADLLRAVSYKTEVDLAAWLRDSFFTDHCKRFHQRPFIWHIWDGRKDGFSALVNYHKLTHKTLENLTYSYLGDWITAQSKSDKVGADLRLAAAQALQEKLKLILAGEPPHDIFVRWKPLHEQPIGWHPDLNDGVRMNIRPFVEAGILRKNPNIKWTKDRGKEPQRDKNDYPWFWVNGTFTGDRVNDVHLTNVEKQAARDKMKAKGAKP